MAPWVTGVKTGHTFGALYVLVGSGQRKGVELISVAIGAPTDEDRFSDNLELLEYGFSPVPAAGPDPSGRRSSPSRRFATPAASCRCARHAASPSACAVASASSVDVEAPSEVEGPIARGEPARARHASSSTDGGRRRCRCGPAARFRGELLRPARGFLGDHPIPIAVAAFAILMRGVLLCAAVRRMTKGTRVIVK